MVVVVGTYILTVMYYHLESYRSTGGANIWICKSAPELPAVIWPAAHELILSILFMVLFIRPLLHIIRTQRREQFSKMSKGVENMWHLSVKYAILGFTTTISSIGALFLTLVRKEGVWVAIDSVIVAVCLAMMGSVYNEAYFKICCCPIFCVYKCTHRQWNDEEKKAALEVELGSGKHETTKSDEITNVSDKSAQVV
ncbi:hypothetical protein RFI_13898 [Reticulomyxa filosa]|uniref:Uncharacterized protein n=1 Tax=Reticulomyxa filosa TaxID=46433 RepID=X6ND78_RETFI|nr:hypothetical protein RFI_13898 [Reticulomyxa filosa]|eukprot:ETO23282.1 hypothetical protein RFI_13898 [Reticulomyxa filosa]